MAGFRLRLLGLGVVAGVVGVFAGAGDARAQGAMAGGDAGVCAAAIVKAEAGRALPRRLMSAIAMTESGRALPGGRVAPWPWTINVGGVGQFFESADAAVAAVGALQASGVRSIDVGCMQVNLMHHPDAFASLGDAFDPGINAAYAAGFLVRLHAGLGTWPEAVGAYHSRDPERAAGYRRRVAAGWPDAGAYGLSASEGVAAAAQVDANRTPEFARRLAEAGRDRARLYSQRTGAGGAVGRSRVVRLAAAGVLRGR